MSVKELSKASTSAEHGKASITKFVFSIGLSLSGGIFEGAIRTFIIPRQSGFLKDTSIIWSRFSFVKDNYEMSRVLQRTRKFFAITTLLRFASWLALGCC